MSYNSPFTGNVIQPTDVSYAAYALTSTTGTIQLEWPLNGNDTDYVAARVMQVSTTSTAYELWMPPANQVSVGQDALIYNTGGVTLTVKSFGGASTIVSIPSTGGSAQYIFITSNGTTTGTWGVIAFGSTTSLATASALAGYGLAAIGSTLNQTTPVTAFASTYTLLASDRASTYVWTGGAGTLSLTSATTLGNNWFVFVRNGGSGTLTVSPTGGNQINGSASLALQPSDSCLIVCSGSAFYTIGLGQGTQFSFTQLTKSVAPGGAFTLSSTEAANVIQKYTGALSSNVTVTMPQTVQIYYITNQTTGPYTITFTTGASGGATATVPTAQQIILLCDSVNLYNASTIAAGATAVTLSNGAVGAPALSFASETTTGVYRPASGEFGISILGVQRLDVTASGITVTGAGTFSGAVSGTTGTFTSGVSGGTFP
jgi:hypothetical protein